MDLRILSEAKREARSWFDSLALKAALRADEIFSAEDVLPDQEMSLDDSRRAAAREMTTGLGDDELALMLLIHPEWMRMDARAHWGTPILWGSLNLRLEDSIYQRLSCRRRSGGS